MTKQELIKILEDNFTTDGYLNLINLDFTGTKIKDVDISNMQVEGNLKQSLQQVGGYLDQWGQEVIGDLDQSNQTVKGDLNQSHHKVKGTRNG